MAAGMCNVVYPCDSTGNVATPPIAPTDSNATSIYFDINLMLPVVPQNQSDLKQNVESALHALTRLFLNPTNPRETVFRPYYVELLRLAQLGLAGPTASPEIAQRALDGMIAELIDNEGGTVKNGRMKSLAITASLLSVPYLAGYIGLRLTPPAGTLNDLLKTVGVDRIVLSCFLLVWVGFFCGVVLSYGARTTVMTLSDLVNTDTDRWLPHIRLLFAGTFTMLFAIFLYLGVVEVKLAGSISSVDIGNRALLAFTIGALCGLSNLALPGEVTKKAASLLNFK